jgi:hypothetical protein
MVNSISKEYCVVDYCSTLSRKAGRLNLALAHGKPEIKLGPLFRKAGR